MVLILDFTACRRKDSPLELLFHMHETLWGKEVVSFLLMLAALKGISMKRARSYPLVMRRWYRPVEYECPTCHRTLRQAMTLSKRTVITLEGVIRLIHAGYRCPDAHCPG